MKLWLTDAEVEAELMRIEAWCQRHSSASLRDWDWPAALLLVALVLAFSYLRW